MRLSVQLDNQSLFRLSRNATRYSRRLQRKLINRLTAEREFAVWEMPYGETDAIKQFIAALKNTFPPEILKETLLFVNNGNGGVHVSYLAAGFPAVVMPHVRPLLNTIVGVVQNFSLSPNALIALSVQGIFDMETKLTPKTVEHAYGRTQDTPAS
jgi:hypothetical protein